MFYPLGFLKKSILSKYLLIGSDTVTQTFDDNQHCLLLTDFHVSPSSVSL